MLGPMRQCHLGDDKMKKLMNFEEWLEDLAFLGEQASNLLREISDPNSIPTIKDVIE